MKTLKDLENQIYSAMESRRQDIKKYHDGIERAAAQVAKANDAVMAAESAGDADQYIKAKADKRAAEDLKELYTKKHARLTADPIIGKQEYDAMLAGISAAADVEVADQNARAAELVAQLSAIAAEYTATWRKANELLHTTQYDLYHDQDCLHAANGKPITRAKEYNNRGAFGLFYNQRIKGTLIAKLAGQD